MAVRILSSRWCAGLDLGKRRDHSALAIAEQRACIDMSRRDPVSMEFPEWSETHIRYLERFALGTEYGAVCDRVAELLRRPPISGQCSLVVDGTGVGAAVVEQLAGVVTVAELLPVTITGSGKATRVSVPKRDLVAAVALELESGRFRIAEGLAHSKLLVDELLNFGVEISAAGNDTYGAWREREHDDLVLAVALACWRLRRPQGDFGEMAAPLLAY